MTFMRSRPVAYTLLCAAAVGLSLSGLSSPAVAGDGRPVPAPGSAGFQMAVLGDTPYGAAQRAQFPALVDDINADPSVRLVLHAGDVKNGSSTCDDERFADLAALYDTFADPFVLTPGDNEWTDCHRTAAGSYVPTERLEAVRRTCFPVPGRTTGGRPMNVDTQAADPQHSAYVENVMFERKDVVFTTLHVVGSENDLAPWLGLPEKDRPLERLAEYTARLAADLDWIHATFDRAEADDAAGVLLLMQAEPGPTPGFQAVRDVILARSATFGKPVLWSTATSMSTRSSRPTVACRT